MYIKCTCGNKGCTTELVIYQLGLPGSLDIAIKHTVGDKEIEERIGLNPNSVIQLIGLLKQALIETV